MSQKKEIPQEIPQYAFPLSEDASLRYCEEFNGMTLRDYFAAAALQGVLSSGKVINAEGVAETAYKYADEMLKERA